MAGRQQKMQPGEMRQLATTYKTNAKRCGEVGAYLRNQTNGKFWMSPAASGFEDNMGKYKKVLAELEQVMTGLSQELVGLANDAESTEGKL